MSSPIDMLGDSDLSFHKKGPPALAIGVAVVLLGLAVAFAFWPSDVVSVEDCGSLTGPKAERVKLRHGMFCNLEAHVDTDQVVAIGQEDPRQADPKKRFADVRYFVKLDSDYTVLAALPAADVAVRKYQARRTSLLGYRVDGIGRVFDPRKEKGYDAMNKALRHQFNVGDRKMLVFDTQATLPK
ncbi:MAG: hypothetical protein ACI9U2_004969 [Bradymonadia bacterium]|jgi:hypothetical protein